MPKDTREIGQETIPPLEFVAPPNRRIGQTGVSPTAVKFRLTEFYDPTTNSIVFKLSNGTTFMTINLTTGLVTITTALSFSGLQTIANNQIVLTDGTNNRINLDGTNGKIRVSRSGYNVLTTGNANLTLATDLGIVKEVWLPLHPQWDNSWTTSDTYVDVSGSEVNSIDFADWTDHTWYFEIIGKTDDGTGSFQLYNVTAAAAVSGSEITTTSTSIVRIRSVAITKPTGVNTIKVQHKQTGGGGAGLVNSIMSRVIFRID